MKEKRPTEEYKLYGGQVTLKFDPVKHLYTVDNKPAHGVTNCIGSIAKPALIPWAVKMTADFITLEWLPGQSYDELQIADILKKAKAAHRTKKETAGDFGTLTHEWIEMWIKGESPEEPVNEVIRKATEQFRDWVETNNVKFLESERKVYSKKYNYAGTCDFLAEINGQLIVGDVKTSSGIYDEYFFQTSAYQQALAEEFPDYKFIKNVIVRVGKDGVFEVGESTEFTENLKAFLGSLAVYNRQQDLKTKEYSNGK